MKSGTDITSMSAINDFYSCILKKNESWLDFFKGDRTQAEV